MRYIRLSDIYTLLSVLFWLKVYLYIIVSVILAEILPIFLLPNTTPQDVHCLLKSNAVQNNCCTSFYHEAYDLPNKVQQLTDSE